MATLLPNFGTNLLRWLLVRPTLTLSFMGSVPAVLHRPIRNRFRVGCSYRAARFILHHYHNTWSVSSIISDLVLEPLQIRLANIRFTLLYKTIHGLITIPYDVLVPYSRTRTYHKCKYRHIQDGASFYNDHNIIVIICLKIK